MIGDTGTHSILRMPTELSAKNVSLEATTEPVRFHTVYNRITQECVGDDFSLNGALDWVAQLNKEDCCEEWSYYANDNAAVVDSMASLVQDHQQSISLKGGQG